MFEDNSEETTFDEEQPPEESSNRNFIIGIGILGGIILLSVACLVGYAFFVLPKQTAQRDTQEATAIAQNVGMNVTLTAMQHDVNLSQTPPATFTPLPTNTPLIPDTSTPTATNSVSDPQTATVAAAQTQAAAAIQTITLLPSVTPPPALPQGGIADELGTTGLVVMAIALVAVILLARRLRSAPGTR
jgi:beta-lactamase regulating signal transducer with metallopeptidase domain